MIKVILWDIDGTVLNFLAAERVAIRTGFRRLGLGECTDEMLEDYSGINKKYWQRLERGEMTKPQILVGRFKEFFEKYGIDTSVAEEFNSRYQLDLGDTICFNDDAYNVIVSLKTIYKQYAVTNGTRTAQRKKLKASGLENVFDGVFISDELGAEKPSAEFFDIALSEIRAKEGPVKNDEILIIGDSLTSDITGGNNAGILTCWYNPGGLKNDTELRVDYEIKNLSEVESPDFGKIPDAGKNRLTDRKKRI